MRERASVLRHAMLAGATISMGCGGPSPLPPPAVEVADSAGVRFVRIPPLSAFGLPEMQKRLLYSTVEISGSELELYRVFDGLFLGDGSLVLVNSGSSELIIIDSEGAAYRRVGREGQGPGEFGRLLRLLPAAPHGFYAWDWRLSLLDGEGRFVETRRLDPPVPVVSMLPLAVLEDGTVISVLGEQRFFQSSGIRRDTVPLMVFSPGSATPDTIGTWLGLERAFSEHAAGQLRVPIGFARTAYYAGNGTHIVIGSSDSLDLTLYSRTLDPTLRVVASAEGPVSEADASRWLELLGDNLPREDPGVRRAYASAPVRDRYPGFDGLELDAAGRIWVGESLRPGQEERRWIVFSSGGEPQGQVRLPAPGFTSLPGRTEVLAVGDGRVAVLRRNRMDEEYVEVWAARPTR